MNEDDLRDERIDSAGMISEAEPERYIRINLTRNSKGFTYDTTVSIRGQISLQDMDRELAELNDIAYGQASAEISRREWIEAGGAEYPAGTVNGKAPVVESVADLPL